MRRLCTIALMFSFAAGALMAATLTKEQLDRLHPVFRQLISSPVTQAIGNSSRRLFSSVASNNVIRYDAIVYTDNADILQAKGYTMNSRLPGFVTMQLSAAELAALSMESSVRFIDPGSSSEPGMDVSAHEIGARLVNAGYLNSTRYKGTGVIILVYDTGIDWKHPDFRDASDQTKSRILSIWDQTLTPTGVETNPSGFSYGVEYSQAHIDAELGASPPGFVRENDVFGHGTHVAGTAAGNGVASHGRFTGVAPLADIVIVKGGNGSFSTAKMVDGLTYAKNIADKYHKPVVVNWSIVSDSGPHDGSKADEVAIDDFVGTAGRVVAVCGGNSGGSPIHVGGTIASGDSVTIQLAVPSYTPAGSGNDRFGLWVRLDAVQSTCVESIITPNGITVVCPTSAAVDTLSSDGHVYIENFWYTGNGNRYLYMTVDDATGSAKPATGTWTIRLSHLTGTVMYHAWMFLHNVGGLETSLVGGDNAYTVTMPGTAAGSISVASHVTKWAWPADGGGYGFYNGTNLTGSISTFSSLGPTADGRQKPDISAPGQGIASAMSSTISPAVSSFLIEPGRMYFIDQGTSMAAPHIAGGAALLLEANPNLTAAQIKTFLTSSANTESNSSVPDYTFGYGKADLLQAMATLVSPGAIVQRKSYSSADLAGNLYWALGGSSRYAVKFTPTSTGSLLGVSVHTNFPGPSTIVGAGSLSCELFSSDGGVPGTRIGNAQLVPLSSLVALTANPLSMIGAGATVTQGVDYFVVLSCPGAGDSVRILSDSQTGGTSSFIDNGSWSAIGQNFRIVPVVITTSGIAVTSVPSSPEKPTVFALNQNYPNPFNPTTVVRYQLPTASKVKLVVFDILGREVAMLVNEVKPAGTYSVQFNASGLASGVYLCKLSAGGAVQNRKMLLVK